MIDADAWPKTDKENPRSQSDRQVGGDHYMFMAVEPWDVIDTFSTQEFIGYHRGVAINYVMRAGRKGDTAEDFGKAAHHLMKCAEVLKQRRESQCPETG